MLDTESQCPSPVPRNCSHGKTYIKKSVVKIHYSEFSIMENENPTNNGSLCSIVDYNSSTSYNFFSTTVNRLKNFWFIALCVLSSLRYLVIVCLDLRYLCVSDVYIMLWEIYFRSVRRETLLLAAQKNSHNYKAQRIAKIVSASVISLAWNKQEKQNFRSEIRSEATKKNKKFITEFSCEVTHS